MYMGKIHCSETATACVDQLAGSCCFTYVENLSEKEDAEDTIPGKPTP